MIKVWLVDSHVSYGMLCESSHDTKVKDVYLGCLESGQLVLIADIAKPRGLDLTFPFIYWPGMVNGEALQVEWQG